MDNQTRIRKNIRALRKAYGESQEELAFTLGFAGKSSISNYETGKEYIHHDTLANIAKHYMVTVEELMFSDFSDIEKISVDENVFLHNLDLFLPIVSTEKAMKNGHFKRGYDYHRKIYDGLKKKNMNGMEHLDKCYEEYDIAFDDQGAKTESAANVFSLWILMVLMIDSNYVMEERPAALVQLMNKDPKVRTIVEERNMEPDDEDVNPEDLKKDPELIETIIEYKKTLKRSDKWSDLGDYLMALQFVYNTIDNDLGREFNRRIGLELLAELASIDNMYAKRYFRFDE